MTNEILSAVAIVLTFVGYYPYIRSIRRGRTKPHVFSWGVWGAVTVVVSFAQLADGGGVGAWPILVSGTITLYVAALAYRRRGDTTISRSDWLFLVLALSALPAWYLTFDPLWAVIILTTADTLGYAPTFRKSYHQPYSENLTFYALLTLRNLIAIAALEHYSLTTILFPAVIAATTAIFIAMVLLRRQAALP